MGGNVNFLKDWDQIQALRSGFASEATELLDGMLKKVSRM